MFLIDLPRSVGLTTKCNLGEKFLQSKKQLEENGAYVSPATKNVVFEWTQTKRIKINKKLKLFFYLISPIFNISFLLLDIL